MNIILKIRLSETHNAKSSLPTIIHYQLIYLADVTPETRLLHTMTIFKDCKTAMPVGINFNDNF